MSTANITSFQRMRRNQNAKPEVDPYVELKKLKKDELIEKAGELDIIIDHDMKKAEILEAIINHLESEGEATE